jgi:hypothetical protein
MDMGGVQTEEEDNGVMPAEVIHEETMEEEDRKTHGSPDQRTQQTAFRESK